MRDWEALLEAERLRLTPAESIYELLSSLPKPKGRIEENISEQAVDALIARKDPLINLGLARYASRRQKIGVLWSEGEIIQLALLANRNAGPSQPTFEAVLGVLHSGSPQLLEALLTNPAVHPRFLARVISNELNLEETRWREIVEIALNNERLTHTLKHDTWDEFTDAMDHAAPIQEVWKLYEKVEATEDWAKVLQFAARLPFDLSLPKSYLPDLSTEDGREDWKKTSWERHQHYRNDLVELVQTKWKTPEGGANEDERMRPWFWARLAFAEAMVKSRGWGKTDFSEHDDPAFRRAHYAATSVFPGWPVHKFMERDGLEVIEAVVFNDTLFEKRNWRVQQEVWRLAYDQKHSDDQLRLSMKRVRERLILKDPEKYGDEPTAEMQEEEKRFAEREERRQAAMESQVEPLSPPTQMVETSTPRRRRPILITAAIVVGLFLLWWNWR